MIKAAVARTPILVFILMFFALGYTVAQTKVVIVPLGAEAGVSGYERVQLEVSTDPVIGFSNSYFLNCPAGKNVLGGGGVTGSARHVLTGTYAANDSSWSVNVTRKSGAASGAATMTLFAICANTIN